MICKQHYQSYHICLHVNLAEGATIYNRKPGNNSNSKFMNCNINIKKCFDEA